MKNFTLTISTFFLIVFAGYGQTIIKIKLDANGKPAIDNVKPTYTLPVWLQLPHGAVFDGQSIGFYKDNNTPMMQKLKISALLDSSNCYYVKIDASYKVTPCSTDNGSCTLKGPFIIKINNYQIPDKINLPVPGAPDDLPAVVKNATFGYPFYDAIMLSKLTVANDYGTIKKILSYYNISGDAGLRQNILLNAQFSGLFNVGTNGLSTSSAVLQSIGNLDVTNIADGLAKFIVARAKQELSTAFFEKFKTQLDTCKRLSTLFPATFSALKTIDQQIYNYSAYLDLLRESFQKDLALLIPNLNTLVNNGSMDVVFQKYPNIKTILSDALYIANGFDNGLPPGDILHNYITGQAKADALSQINPYIFPSIQTIDLLSQSFRSKYGKKYWVSADSVKMVFANQKVAEIFWGLVYQRIPDADITFGAVKLKTSINNLAGHFDEIQSVYQPYLTNLVTKAGNVDQYYQSVKQSKNQVDYQDYYGLINSTADLLQYLTSCPALVKLPPIDLQKAQQVSQYLNAFRSIGNIYVDVYHKQYPSAILELTTLYRDLVPGSALNQVNDYNIQLTTIQSAINIEKDDVKKAALKKQADDIQKAISSLQKYADSENKIAELFIKYGNFVATVAKAQSSDDVQNAIEAIAMPAGSSRVKRSAQFNVSLNAYVGPYFGGEQIHGFDKKATGTFGLTAPIGVALSWGNFICKDMSISGFLSVIDIGAVTSYRFGNNTIIKGTDTLKTGQIPTIQLKDIISPGFFLSIGLPKLPISISGGFQLAPNLRSISVVDNKNNVLDANTNGLANSYTGKLYTRWSISIVVDIPILNLYTKGN